MDDPKKNNSQPKKAYVPPHRRRQQGNSYGDNQKTTIPTTIRVDLDLLDRSLTYIRCINLKQRPDKWNAFRTSAQQVDPRFADKIQRFDAVDGGRVLSQDLLNETEIQLTWDSTTNAKYTSKVIPGTQTMTPGEVGCALSHVALWRELAACNDPDTTMLILEDDAVFTTVRGTSRFANAFGKAWKQLPQDWAMLYLGLSDRGERTYVASHNDDTRQGRRNTDPFHPTVEIYRPEYGYHTHAYVMTKAAASALLQHLPISGPIDVWLADHQWFGLAVYCAVIANEGWRNQDGTYEGALLVSQQRGRGTKSDIPQSASRASATR